MLVEPPSRNRLQLKKIATMHLLDKHYKYVSYSVFLATKYDMLILSFTLGIRPSEICGISESDVMQNGILCLNRGYDRYGSTSDLKTESSHRSLELTELLLKLINKRFTYKKKI